MRKLDEETEEEEEEDDEEITVTNKKKSYEDYLKKHTASYYDDNDTNENLASLTLDSTAYNNEYYLNPISINTDITYTCDSQLSPKYSFSIFFNS